VGLLDPLGIPIGKNNKLIKKVHFEAGQADDLVSYLRLDDDTNPRFAVPDDVLPRPGDNNLRRFGECGMSLSLNPFELKFTDTRNNSNVFIHMNNSNFYMTDKFIQLDF
jgi:hypothetical protein